MPMRAIERVIQPKCLDKLVLFVRPARNIKRFNIFWLDKAHLEPLVLIIGLGAPSGALIIIIGKPRIRVLKAERR